MKPIDREQTGARTGKSGFGRRILWFGALYLAGVFAVLTVAYVLRAVIVP